MLERDLASEIERWWEEEADLVASCPTDSAVCRLPHVFEEAVRAEDGAIVACTVHGRRLAEKLAAHLIRAGREEEERFKRVTRETFPILLSEQTFRLEREGNWPQEPRHVQGCGAGKDVTKACICPASGARRAARLRREHLAGSHRPYCGVIAYPGGTCDCGAVEAAAKLAHAAMQQDDEADEALAEEERRLPFRQERE